MEYMKRLMIKSKLAASALCGTLLAVLSALYFRLRFFSGGENCFDAFYHVRIAAEGWGVYAADSFPAMTMSLWTKCFADKELLYHWLLAQVQSAGACFGIPLYPFHLQSLFFIILLCSAFAILGYALRLRYLLFLVPVFLLLEFLFLDRMLMVRPHTFSAALMLMACFAYLHVHGIRTFWIPTAVGFLYVWSYSNPHFVLLPASVFFFVEMFYRRSSAIILLLGTFTGLVLGFLVHPQFPNNLVNWWVQCVDVPIIMMSGAKEFIPIGDEILVSFTFPWRTSGFLMLLYVCSLGLLVHHLYVRGWKVRRIRPVIWIFLLLASVTMFGQLFAIRMIEYSVSMNLIFFGLLLSKLRLPILRTPRRKVLIPIFLLVTAVLLFWHDTQQFSSTRKDPQSSAVPVKSELAQWVRTQSGLRPGTLIANLFWFDFPRLYYVLPEYRYLCGLDPSFGSVAYPENYARLHAFMLGKYPLTRQELIETIGGPIVFIDRRYAPFVRMLVSAGSKILYGGKDGYVLDLKG